MFNSGDTNDSCMGATTGAMVLRHFASLSVECIEKYVLRSKAKIILYLEFKILMLFFRHCNFNLNSKHVLMSYVLSVRVQ